MADSVGAFQYRLPQYPERDKIGPGPTWGEVYDTATDRRTLKELWPGTAFANAIRSTGDVLSGEGDLEDAMNIGGVALEAVPAGKLATLLPFIPAINRIRKASDWGSYQMGEKAQEHLAKGADPVDVWHDYGWINKPYGVDSPLVTAIDTRGTGYIHQRGSTLGERFDHPELYEFDPELAKTPVSLSVDPRVDVFTGETVATDARLPSRSWRNRFGDGPSFTERVTGKPMKVGIGGTGQNHQQMSSGLHHEVGHLVAYKYGLPQGATTEMSTPQYNTDAVQEAAQFLKAIYGNLYDAPPSDIDGLMQIARRSRYLNAPGERTSRGIAAAYDMGLGPLESLAADPFGDAAAAAFRDKEFGAFRARPFMEGDVRSVEMPPVPDGVAAFRPWEP